MFGLFKSASVNDPQFGTLTRKGGLWRGSLTLGAQVVPLALCGTSEAPDPSALTAASGLAEALAAQRAALAQALLDHAEPYAQEAGLTLESPEAVWAHVQPVFVSVAPQGGALITEVGYSAAWDEEHTLGARFAAGALTELNGSVLPP